MKTPYALYQIAALSERLKRYLPGLCTLLSSTAGVWDSNATSCLQKVARVAG